MRWILAGFGAVLAAGAAAGQQDRGVVLGDLSWAEAERALTPSTVVVLPLAAGSLEHGPHLRLDSDDRLVRHLSQRIRAAADVVIAPSLPYHFYSAYQEYPGSTSLEQDTARNVTIDIARSLAKHGPRRFYVLNTGTTTMFALKEAADALAEQGILLGYTDIQYRLANARVDRQQRAVRGSTHADEAATSMMLFVDPSAVDMKRAAAEYGSGSGPLTRQKDGAGTYSASGVIGDPTAATREKGRAFVDAVVAGALEDVELIRTAPLPAARAAIPAPAPVAPRPQPQRSRTEALMPNGCTAAEERAIRAVGDRFSYLWRQMDARNISVLFSDGGDMRHPDGTIEKGQAVIFQNRNELFGKREFRGSVHPVTLTDIRCLNASTAIADGKWELRMDEAPTAGAPARNLGGGRRHSGLCTLVLVGGSGSWTIEAWRYTVNPPDGAPPPTTLKQPGFIGRGGF